MSLQARGFAIGGTTEVFTVDMQHLATPALVLDATRLERNLSRMASHLEAHAVSLRPHVKTGKNARLARMCCLPDAESITVSTLAEAEYFARHGFADICYAVGIAPDKLDRVLALRHEGVALTVLLDNAVIARALCEHGRAHGHSHAVLLEIDCDGHRCGLAPDAPELLEIAALLAREGQTLAGVLTHAGSAYDLAEPSPAAFAALAEQERLAVVRAAASLRAAGHACPVVSMGSTPTALFGTDFAGITEVRAGVYPFQDLVMSGLGVCGPDDIAVSVLCTVIGHQPHSGNLVVDAGWAALSRDAGLPRHFAQHGYGLVANLNGTLLPGLAVVETSQEHGIIAPREPGMSPPARSMPPGTRLRILPVHACATAAMHDAWQLCRDQTPLASLSRCRGW